MQNFKKLIGILLTILTVPLVLLALSSLGNVVLMLINSGFTPDLVSSGNLFFLIICPVLAYYLFNLSNKMLIDY